MRHLLRAQFAWWWQSPRGCCAHQGPPGAHVPVPPCASAAPLMSQPRRLYISAKFELMIGAVFVILHQAALVSGVYLCDCSGSFFPSLLSSDMSGLQSKRIVNSLLQLGELNAITRVFVTNLQIPASNLPSGWMLQS